MGDHPAPETAECFFRLEGGAEYYPEIREYGHSGYRRNIGEDDRIRIINSILDHPDHQQDVQRHS